ncbi:MULTISPECIES: formimidoylglutamase [Clostridium]|jgi:formiminoglutamase|uniref:Formimidoylglutamase n=1 Tax=Clostridium lapidicellarium TaxID=3240931 RepID=A0ABV4DUN8_9CLOT
MFDFNYKTTDNSIWKGRIDSTTDFNAFRWHQWIKNIDLRNPDLKPYTGKLGFGLIGFCCDEGVKINKGRTGASKGPKSIRLEMANLPCFFTKDVRLFDCGDVYCEGSSLGRSQNLLAEAVYRILGLNLFPIVLGGGHETALGNYKGMLKNLDKFDPSPDIGIINFDAHFDIRPYKNYGSSGTMFRQIHDINTARNINYSYLCIGIQIHSNTLELFKTADRLGIDYILAKDINEKSNPKVLDKLSKFIEKHKYIYVTTCSDVFSSSYAPGVSATQSFGLDPEIVLKYLKYILKSNKVVSFDICEVSPRFDQDNATANLAAVIVFSLVNTLCEIKNLSLQI